jgi:integrase
MAKLARYMQLTSNNKYRYNPPRDAIEAGIVKCVSLSSDFAEAITFCNNQNELLDEWRKEHRYLKNLSSKSNINDLIKSYSNSLEYSKLSVKSKRDYLYYLKQWNDSRTAGTTLIHTRLADLSTPMCQRIYDLHATHSISLANHVLAIYRLLFSYAIRNGFTTFNPFTNVKRRSDRPRRTVWSKDDIKAFMDTAFSKYEWRSIGLIVYTAYVSAQRLGDMRMLTWSNYNLDTGVLTLEQSKRRARVAIPLSSTLQTMLAQQHADIGWQQYMFPAPKSPLKPYTLTGLAQSGREVMEAAGLSNDLQMMDLRRTAITEMVDAAVPISNIMSMSGHATPHSLTPYMKATLKSSTVAQEMRGMV